MLDTTLPASAYSITREEVAQARAEFDAARVDSNTFLVETTEAGAEYLKYNPAEDSFTVVHVDDPAPVLEWCKGRFNDGLANRYCEFRHVASYPPIVLEIWARENGIDPRYVTQALGKDRDLTKRLLNNRDLSGFRTLAGRV
jgi:hypothetical protein